MTPDGLRIRGPETGVRIAYTSITSLEGSPGRLRLTSERSDLTVTGPPELIQALHIELRTRGHLDANAGQIPDLVRAAVGLEEDYLLYTIFGPFYELHAALLGEGAELGSPVTEPNAAVFQVGLTELQRHLDQVAYVLPAFIRHRDALLVDGPEPGWLKADETALRVALAPVQRATAEVGQLAAQVSRLIDLDPAELPKVSYGGAAVSLGAAALVRPGLRGVRPVAGLRGPQPGRPAQEPGHRASRRGAGRRSWTAGTRWSAADCRCCPT